MSTIALSPQLIEELEQVANEQAMNLEKLLEDAVRIYLRQLEREKIKAEATAFQEMHTTLLKEYLGQYVALHNGGNRSPPLTRKCSIGPCARPQGAMLRGG